MQAVILAGGLGTRLSEYTKEIPKPMLVMNGKPVLEYQIENLKRYGINEIILVIGYLGNKIQEYFGDGSAFNVKIQYFQEKNPLGTAGALYYLKDILRERFILTYGDIIFDIDFDRFTQFHLTREAIGSLVVHPNNHPYDSDLVVLDEQCVVKTILKKNVERDFYYNNCVNAGIFLFDREVLNYVKGGLKQDLEKDIIQFLISGQKLFGYKTTEYLKDMGTTDRYLLVQEHLAKDIVPKRNLSNKQKAVFLDRDGTINIYKGLISKPEDLEIMEEAYAALEMLNNSEYLNIVITNQPVVARNLCTIEELENIHKKLESDLGLRHVYIDDLYYCPHHPDKGYPEENKFYKVECECRKPKIGLIQKAAQKYNIDLSASYFIGDSTVDIQTGKTAGLHTILLATGEAGNDGKYNIQPDFGAANLLEATKIIIRGSD